MAKPFVVSLVCTKDDVYDLREVIKASLTLKGYSVFAFDEANYPYMPGMDPSECSVALATHPDVLILILDQRYGERLSNRLSVTENEWRNAQQSQAPFIVACVRKKAIYEFEQWKAVGGEWEPRYVDDIDLLKFIESLRHTTYLLEFDSAEDLRAKLDQKMKSLTPFIFHRVALATHESAGSKRTVTVIGEFLSFSDVFEKDLYVTPPYRLVSGKLPGHNLEEDAVTCLRSHQNMIITGGPGTGKSTALVKSLYQRIFDMHDNPLLAPIYVDCHRLSSRDFTSVESLLSKLFELSLDKIIWPHFDQCDPNLEVELYFDALDEVRNGTTLLDKIAAESPIWVWCHHLLTCRRDFLSRALSNPSISGRYQHIAELLPWDLPHIQSYVGRKFFNDKQRANEMLKIIKAPGPIYDLASNIIGLVMLCSLDNVSRIDNAATLYDAFLTKWAVREAHRVGDSTFDVDMALSVWRRIAWQLLISGRDGGVTISSLLDILGKYDKRLEIMNSSVTQSLMLTISPSNESVIVGFIHDSIYEYLLAAELVERLQSTLDPAADALEQDTWYEVNEFAQQLMLKWNGTVCAHAVGNLVKAYQNRLNDNGPKGLLLRNKACYYIGRLGRQSSSASTQAFSFLDNAWQEEKSNFVRQSIGFARSIAGLRNAVKEFVNEMQCNAELDSLNRGYHLAYYGDIKGQNPPYHDSGKGSWQQTRRALIDRFGDNSDAKRNCRIVDLYTFRRFLETRGEKPTAEELEVIKAILRNLDSYQTELKSSVENESSKIIKLSD